ncbi:MAG TPA: S1/P1 nuclease [Thermoanaerobaculia bacterium]|nr:S1/P1 nuclease [Thermoanaerobaculia bacterium]
MSRPGARLAALFATGLLAVPAAGWNDTTHRTLAAIAWERLPPATRQAAVELLRAAPAASGIPQLRPAAGKPAERDRQLFLAAAAWADLPDGHPWDRPEWHYVNHFWQDVPGEPPRRLDWPPKPENVVERIAVLSARLADGERPAAERAVDLAWLLHLVGDVHQPLHTSARVTAHPDERRGDRGGNAFLLHTPPGRQRPLTLHLYWDGILEESRRRRPREPRTAYVDRAARELAAAHPAGDVLPGGGAGTPEQWAREGLAAAQGTVYPPWLRRGQRPPERYRELAWQQAAPAIARAGHRLADLLQRVLA